MTTQEMVDLVRDRSKQSDTAKILRELRAAFRWCSTKVFLVAGGAELLSTIGQELTLAADTRDYDLADNVTVTGTFLGLKQIWAKLPGDTMFTPMVERDILTPEFQIRDSQPAATPDVARGHPILYQPYNFSQLRFAPTIPATSVLRVDFFHFGPVLDPTTNNSPDVGVDLTSLFHDAVACKASAHCLENLDDDRTGAWETRARDYLNDAVYAATKKSGPTLIQGWTTRRRRMI